MRRLLFTLTLVAVLVSPAQALFSVLGLKNSMVQFLLEQISTEGEFEVTADQVDEPEEGVTAIRGLKIADADGVWFTAERLNFSWNPSRLLNGEVEFSNLSMQDVTVLRKPGAKVAPAPPPEGTAEPDTPFDWPRSPLTIRIDRMALERVTVAEPVLGHALAFNAEGAARDEGDIQSARLKLTRTDTVPGIIDFAYERNFTANTLAVDLNAEEGANGLIAALSGLPPEAASRLVLVAKGPPTDWQTELDLALADTISAQGSARISYAGPVKVDADFRARPGPRLSSDLAALLGAEAQIRARVEEGSDGVVLIEEARLVAPDVTMTASGSYARPTGAADLAVNLRVTEGVTRPFDGVDLSTVQFDGTVTGAPGDLTARGQLDVQGLKTAPVDLAQAALNIDLRQSGPSERVTTTLQIDGDTDGLRLDRIAAQTIGPARLDIDMALTGDALSLARADLQSGVLKITASGDADLASTDADLTIDLTTERLGQVAGAYGVDAQGRLSGKGRVVRRAGVTDADLTLSLSDFNHPQVAATRLDVVTVVRNEGGRTAFDVRGDAAGLRIDEITPDLIGPARLSVAGVHDGESVQLDRGRLRATLVEADVSGRLSLADGTGVFDYDLRLPDMAPAAGRYDMPLKGAALVRGKAMLAPEAPRLDGQAEISGLVWQGQRHGNISLTHDVTLGVAPAGPIRLRVRRGLYGDADIKTVFRYATPELRLEGLDARVLGAHAQGDLVLDTSAVLAHGDMRLSIGNLASLSRMTGQAMRGAVTGSVKLDHAAGQQNVQARLSGRGLAAGDTQAASMKLTASVRDATGTPAVDSTVKLAGVAAGGITLSDVNATLRGPLSRLGVTLSANGEMARKTLTARSQLVADLDGAVTGARIADLQVSWGEDRAYLANPLSVTRRGQTISTKGLDLSLPGGGWLRGDVIKRAASLAGDLHAEIPDLSIFGRLAGAPVKRGRLDLRASFDTARARGTADVQARDLQMDGVHVAGALGVDMRAEWQGARARLDGALSGSFGDPVSLSAEVPMRRGGLIPSLARRGPVSGALTWRGRLDDLWALVPAAGHILSGKAEIDLGVEGDVSSPDLTGGIILRDGGYQNLDLGTILTDLTLETSLTGDGALDLDLSASDGAKGRVSTKGRVALDASGIDLVTRIERAVLVRRDDARVRAGGEIAVKGPVNALSVAGTITVDGAEIRLVNANPPSVASLGEVLIKGAPPRPARSADSSVSLDLKIAAPGRIFVRGRGLDSEWQADLAISGDAAKPRMTGRIERVRGRLDLIGKGFDLKTGRITFDGGRIIDPRIDIVLERATPDLTGRIVVDGLASDPRLSFTSTPALPEDEVLPQTLFGKSSQALSASQAVQLGLGLATLMDGGGGTLDAVRSTAGLDALRVEQDADGNTSIAAGKQVTEDIWVGTRQGVSGGGTSVVVEIDIFDNVTLDAEAGSDSGSSVGVQWKKDF